MAKKGEPMRSSSLFILSLALLAAPAFAEDAPAYPNPQDGAPGVYKQLFDNERVRVSEITFKPGDKAPMHTHAYDHAVYVIEGGSLTLTKPDGSSSVATVEAGQVVWFPAETHEAVNTGTTTVRGTVTELK
jgi:beta-alanine degradation protein BauB